MLQFHDYLLSQMKTHVSLFFREEANALFSRSKIVFLPFQDAIELRGKVIALPTNHSSSISLQKQCVVEFNHTNISLWNLLPKPACDGWVCVPDATAPLWYQHWSGTIIPAWDIYSNLRCLLTFREEHACPERDIHGRFASWSSPRKAAGLLQVPAFNEAVAVLVAACISLHKNETSIHDLQEFIRPPVLVLSHDCDLLHGNDAFTQSIRFYRILRAIAERKRPPLKNIWWILRNVLYPKVFYYNNIQGMIDVERLCNYTSSFYFLSGSGGRYGARSGDKLLDRAIKDIPDNWEIGMHYNYDTHLHDEKFLRQKSLLERLCGKQLETGRAHYLRYDSLRSPRFLSKHGIRCDESGGYSDAIGYRYGVAGCFQPYDSEKCTAMDIWEVPLTIMDGVLLDQHPDDPLRVFTKMLDHIHKIGGAISILFHPGMFFNPEFPTALGLYRKMLTVAKQCGSESRTALQLVRSISSQ